MFIKQILSSLDSNDNGTMVSNILSEKNKFKEELSQVQQIELEKLQSQIQESFLPFNDEISELVQQKTNDVFQFNLREYLQSMQKQICLCFIISLLSYINYINYKVKKQKTHNQFQSLFIQELYQTNQSLQKKNQNIKLISNQDKVNNKTTLYLYNLSLNKWQKHWKKKYKNKMMVKSNYINPQKQLLNQAKKIDRLKKLKGIKKVYNIFQGKKQHMMKQPLLDDFEDEFSENPILRQMNEHKKKLTREEKEREQYEEENFVRLPISKKDKIRIKKQRAQNNIKEDDITNTKNIRELLKIQGLATYEEDESEKRIKKKIKREDNLDRQEFGKKNKNKKFKKK